MKTTIKHGVELETLTPDELRATLSGLAEQNRAQRVRASQAVALDAAGAGMDEVYTVPMGWEFEARRVSLDLDTATDPSTGNVPLNVAGRSVEYLRSGVRIEYGVPQGPNVAPQVPGIQSWGDEQGPYLRNGEVFEVRARGLTANSRLMVTVEGILKRPSSRND